MTEKTASKYLLNLEKQFANNNPVLLKASKLFQELDQIEYDLGLIELDETTACKYSWWPIVSLIGGNSTAKSRFINSYLGSEQLLSGIQASSHKFTVLLHSSQPNSVTLLGSALDVDPRYPFYQISSKIERQQEGEGSRVNAYLELKTIQSERLKGKLFIDAPNIVTSQTTPIISLLTKHTIENSDLVLVFTDAFEQESPLVNELIQHIINHQDSNKFIYLIDEPAASLNISNANAIISLWQRKLSELGINTGQFIVLSNPQNALNLSQSGYFAEIDQRLANVEHDRSYRIVDSLEKSIHDIENVVIPEVKKGIVLWKERSNISTVVVLTFIAMLAIFAEIQIGILESLIDPIIGPVALAALIAVMVPAHLIISRIQAKLIVQKLNARQKELHLMENLADMFERNMTFSRMILPTTEPIGWNKKTRAGLLHKTEKAKELVQALNDYFSSYNGLPPNSQQPSSLKDVP
ncbi:MAG: hypothetical protein Q8N96_14990 [Methylovulum sp.]|nr:hypothetical protein [Methylovulum sp.]